MISDFMLLGYNVELVKGHLSVSVVELETIPRNFRNNANDS